MIEIMSEQDSGNPRPLGKPHPEVMYRLLKVAIIHIQTDLDTFELNADYETNTTCPDADDKQCRRNDRGYIYIKLSCISAHHTDYHLT